MGYGFKSGVGGANPLNFKVVGGTTEPTNPKENTIWVNTDEKITSWHFGAEEPNVYNIQTEPNYRWQLYVPHPLRDGDILNFTIPGDVTDQFEAIRLQDSAGKEYYVRQGSGSAVAAWPTGTKVGVRISNVLHPITGWVGHGTAFLMAWESYYHEVGTAWISTGTSSPVAFNALKKNGIQVCPISAKQYVSGMLVNKTAKIYQGGKWVELVADNLIYENGTQYKSLVSIAGTVSFGTKYITLSANNSGSRVGTTDKINLTKFKTVIVDYSDKTSDAEISIKIMSDRNNVITRQNHINTTSGTMSCDISSVTGDCYVEVQLYSERSASARINKIQVLN